MLLHSNRRLHRGYRTRRGSSGRRKVLIFFLLVVLLLAAWWAYSGQKDSAGQEVKDKEAYTLPRIPSVITTSRARASYLLLHYWEHFNFRDTALISRPEIIEQAFVNFLDVLPEVSLQEAEKGITALMDSAASDSAMYVHFTNLASKYLYEPNSPFRNEEYYIPVLRHIIALPRMEEPDKSRPRFLLDMALKNRPGEVAADFVYTRINGSRGRLLRISADYTLLFFNSPDCEDCRRVKGYMAASEHFAGMTGEGSARRPRLVILAVYPDEDVEQWRAASYPPCMLNVHDASQAISRQRLYDLKAIPCLYLLDADKRVLLKDVTVEHVELYLREHARN